jgi:AraC family transcriptional activator of pobA
MDFRDEPLTVDRLPDAAAPVQVLAMENARLGADGQGPRAPHRHDYHELFWARTGTGRHLVDGRPLPLRAGTVTIVGKGQVHVLERARDFSGAVVRFNDEAVQTSAWLVGARDARVIVVPPAEADRLTGAIEALAAETRRPRDGASAQLQLHLLATILLWIERWYDAARTQRREADDAEVQLYRRFTQVLERDYARHHDAAHYAEALAVPAAALSRALAQVTGRGTKELVTERVMLEAARLLRFTDLTVGEIAFRTGFRDPLYFSRAFKRHYGEPPAAFRSRAAGG